MKVLHFGRFYGGNFGGLERHVALLLRGLTRSIHVDNLVASEDLSMTRIEVDGCRVYKAPSLGIAAGAALCPTMPWWARKLHRQERYDIAHLHFPDPMSHLAALALPRGIKLVISWHSDVVRQKNLLKLYRPFLDRIVARADAIIAATPLHFSSSTQLTACADRSRLRVVPYGIDFLPFEQLRAIAAGRALRARFAGRRLIFAIGRHVYYKGLEFLVRAMPRVRPDAVLLVGGHGPLTESLKALAQSLRLGDRAIFLGRIADEDLPAHYHAADVFCMPSVERSEAFGQVQVEAMACRKPVVCCDLGNGVNYVSRHGVTGLVVPPRDPGALARALNELLDDERTREKMGEAGYTRAKREFTLDNMWSGTLQVYREITR